MTLQRHTENGGERGGHGVNGGGAITVALIEDNIHGTLDFPNGGIASVKLDTKACSCDLSDERVVFYIIRS